MLEKEKQTALYGQIREIAEKYGAEKVVLFGSRARKDHYEKSDIDLAVYGCRCFDQMLLDLEENLWTLLALDVVNMDCIAKDSELIQEIERDGVMLYEKI